jgi:DNA-binding MarR family transcriptional regulator
MAMKELGRRLHCDPSFVTVIADGLEKRGLARREAHPGDRRIRNIVLTDAGQEMRLRMERELATLMPWSKVLDAREREQLLGLLRKMASTENAVAPDDAEVSRLAPTGEVDDAVSTASAGLA